MPKLFSVQKNAIQGTVKSPRNCKDIEQEASSQHFGVQMLYRLVPSAKNRYKPDLKYWALQQRETNIQALKNEPPFVKSGASNTLSLAAAWKIERTMAVQCDSIDGTWPSGAQHHIAPGPTPWVPKNLQLWRQHARVLRRRTRQRWSHTFTESHEVGGMIEGCYWTFYFCFSRYLWSATWGVCGTAEDDQHDGRARSAHRALATCVHPLLCSKKHLPFSVVSLTQKTHRRPLYLPTGTSAAVQIQGEGWEQVKC